MNTITVPKGSPDPLPELAAFVQPIAPLFRRRTSRTSLERYVTGLLTDLPRKNCEAIAQAVANTSLEQLQHLLTDAAWDPLALDEQRVRLLVEHSPTKACWCSTIPAGKASVGVHHQYSGTDAASKAIANLLSAPSMWSLIPARVSRGIGRSVLVCICPRTGHRTAPASLTFATKLELALQLLERATAWGVPFGTIVTDAGYGIPSFVRALDQRGVPYVCGTTPLTGERAHTPCPAISSRTPASSGEGLLIWSEGVSVRLGWRTHKETWDGCIVSCTTTSSCWRN